MSHFSAAKLLKGKISPASRQAFTRFLVCIVFSGLRGIAHAGCFIERMWSVRYSTLRYLLLLTFIDQHIIALLVAEDRVAARSYSYVLHAIDLIGDRRRVHAGVRFSLP